MRVPASLVTLLLAGLTRANNTCKVTSWIYHDRTCDDKIPIPCRDPDPNNRQGFVAAMNDEMLPWSCTGRDECNPLSGYKDFGKDDTGLPVDVAWDADKSTCVVDGQNIDMVRINEDDYNNSTCEFSC